MARRLVGPLASSGVITNAMQPSMQPPSPASSFGSFLRSYQVMEYIATAGIMFIPTSFRYYEVATEGCYALSHLIRYFNRMILSSTLSRCRKMEDYMIVITQGISHVEVLAEKFSYVLGGEKGQALCVLFVEMVKALCRLVILAERRKPTLLIHWGRYSDPDDVELDLSQYEYAYKCLYQESRRQLCHDNSYGEFPVATASLAGGAGEAKVVGRRSGLVLNLGAVRGGALPRATAVESNGGPMKAYNATVSGRSGEEHFVQGVGSGPPEGPPGAADAGAYLLISCGNDQRQPDDQAFRLLPHSLTPDPQGSAQPQSPRATSSPDDVVETALRGESGSTSPAASSTISEDDETAVGEHSPAADHISISSSRAATSRERLSPPPMTLSRQIGAHFPTVTANHMVYLGEVLYVLRPAIYAWALHRVHSLRADRARSAGVTTGNTGDNNGASHESARMADTTEYAEEQEEQEQEGNSEKAHVETRWINQAAAAQASRGRSSGMKSTLGALNHGFARLKTVFSASAPPSSSRGSSSSGSMSAPPSSAAEGQTARGAEAASEIGRFGLSFTEIDHLIAVAVSLAVEVLSVRCTSAGLRMAREAAQRAAGGAGDDDRTNQPSSVKTTAHAFDAELHRRQLCLLYYFIRSPLFDRATLPLLQMASRLLERVPLLNSLPSYALNILTYLHRTHFYTSASS